MGLREPCVDGNGALKHGAALDERCGIEFQQTAPATDEVVIGLGIDFAATLPTCAFALREGHFEHLDDLSRYFVLDHEDVLEVPVVAVRPDMAAGFGIDELDVDAHPRAGLSHAAFEHVSHAQLPSHISDVDVSPLESKRRVARDHEEAGHLGDVGDDVFGHAVGEVLLFGVAAHVGERQYCEGWLVGQAQRRRSESRCRCDAIRR